MLIWKIKSGNCKTVQRYLRATAVDGEREGERERERERTLSFTRICPAPLVPCGLIQPSCMCTSHTQ